MSEEDPQAAGAHVSPASDRAPPKDVVDLVGESSASDSEHQHALEVIFDENVLHRRKSSMVSADLEEKAKVRHKHRTGSETECFVHQLLEEKNKANRLAASRSSSSSNTPGSSAPGTSAPGTNALSNIAENREKEHENCDGRTATHSRLLTKKQLSDMAWGVRALSKKLGSLRLKLRVKTVFLLTKAHDEDLIGYTRTVAEWLLSNERQVKYTVYVENTLEKNRKFDAEGLLSQCPTRDGRLKYWTNELCQRHPNTFDFVVTLGGDGTVLYASWLFQRIVPPVLSFALGSLGFLTKFDFEDYQSILTNSFRDGITVSLRLRFEGTVMRAQNKKPNEKRDLVEELIGEESENYHTHKPDGSYEILNDIVVDRGPNSTMSAIEIFGDDEHFTTVQADGVCVATPTGSTAYNLAAGGSLCHPENPVILITAICAHTLSFRPIILPDTVVLRVGVPYDARASSWASFDGRERVELCKGDYVTISASRYPFASVMPQGRRSEDWVNSISRTLQWNSRQKQKSFKEWEKEEEAKVEPKEQGEEQ